MGAPPRLTCEQTFRRLDDYLDRALSVAEMASVQRHLDVCARCAAEYRFEAVVVEEIRRKIRRIAVPRRLRAAVLARLALAGGSSAVP